MQFNETRCQMSSGSKMFGAAMNTHVYGIWNIICTLYNTVCYTYTVLVFNTVNRIMTHIYLHFQSR